MVDYLFIVSGQGQGERASIIRGDGRRYFGFPEARARTQAREREIDEQSSKRARTVLHSGSWAR